MTEFNFHRAKCMDTLEVMVRGQCRKMGIQWLERHHSLRQAANFYAPYRPKAAEMFDQAAERQKQLELLKNRFDVRV